MPGKKLNLGSCQMASRGNSAFADLDLVGAAHHGLPGDSAQPGTRGSQNNKPPGVTRRNDWHHAPSRDSAPGSGQLSRSTCLSSSTSLPTDPGSQRLPDCRAQRAPGSGDAAAFSLLISVS